MDIMRKVHHLSLTLFLFSQILFSSCMFFAVTNIYEGNASNSLMLESEILQGFNATLTFQERQEFYQNLSRTSNDLYAQSARLYFGDSLYEPIIQAAIDHVNLRKDTSDFRMNAFVRLLYYDNMTHGLNNTLRDALKNCVLNFKYWYNEPGLSDCIMWTENHIILFHTAELLAGQLYPDEIFPNSGMTGQEHMAHAIPLILQWIGWRARFGFSEWHSDIYITLDIMALMNLMDFAQNSTIATKAAMLIDTLAFDFANNYYLSLYATTHGRTEDSKKVGVNATRPASWESTSQVAWILLGLGQCNLNDAGNGAAVSIALSEKYAPPPILEDIAGAARLNNEHKERNSINFEDGPTYGIGYTSENDIVGFWWPMSGPTHPLIAERSLAITQNYNIKLKLVYNDALFVDLIRIGGLLYGTSFSGFCQKISDITIGSCLESISTYTYRTPYYQLSGAQDHHKGNAGLQQHIWQASLDTNAIVYTSSPGGVSSQQFSGGWYPRATMYKNIGIIQYDRLAQLLITELVFAALGTRNPYTHAYFPRWAFDEVVQEGKWTFGQKGDSYVALYSYGSTKWMSNYELRSPGKKNVYIVELGSVADYGSFANFTESISSAVINVKKLDVGFSVCYVSPLRGEICVCWDGPMTVEGVAVDIGPYERFENPFCTQTFGTNRTEITYGTQSLILDFDAGTRTYSEV